MGTKVKKKTVKTAAERQEARQEVAKTDGVFSLGLSTLGTRQTAPLNVSTVDVAMNVGFAVGSV